MICFVRCFLIAIAFTSGLAQAQNPFGIGNGPGGPKNVALRLLTDKDPVAPGETFHLVVQLEHSPGWNSYWTNPGTGMATSFEWTLPEGFQPGETLWPIPKVKDAGELGTNHIYVDTIQIVTPVKVPADAQTGDLTISVKASWLECDINACAPSGGDASVNLTVGGQSTPVELVQSAVNKVQNQQPATLDGWSIKIDDTAETFRAVLTPAEGASSDPGDIYFFESGDSPQLEYLMPEIGREGNDWTVAMKRSETEEPLPVEGFFYASNGWTPEGEQKALAIPQGVKQGPGALKAAPDPTGNAYVTLDGKAEKKLTIGKALLLAFVGGFLLNLMPCVFPVLGIKIMGFVQQAGDDPGKIKIHGMVFTAGLVFSLWILAAILVALNLAGNQLGWGFQLSSPGFLAFIILLLFLMALNLFGVFEIGTSLMGVGSSQVGNQKGYSGSFWSGVLTTLIATPCSGPFLGTTIGFTLKQSIPVSFLIFTALALGIAFPYVALSLNPNLIKKLPKPGGWMVTFKKILAFPLLATVIYFLNSFAHQRGREGLILLLVCLLIAGIAAWIYGSWCTPIKSKSTRRIGMIASVLFALGAIFSGRKALATESQVGLLREELAQVQAQLQDSIRNGGKVAALPTASKDGLDWQTWSPELIRDLRNEGRLIFMDYTASW